MITVRSIRPDEADRFENAPMIAAMERAGHRSDLRPWHVWHYRRQVP